MSLFNYDYFAKMDIIVLRYEFLAIIFISYSN